MIDLVIALINGVFSLILLFLGFLLNRRVKRVKDQVENDHHTNLRVEQDERHEASYGLLSRIHSDVSRALKEVERLRDSEVQNRQTIRRIWERLDKHSDHIRDLEVTHPRERETIERTAT